MGRGGMSMPISRPLAGSASPGTSIVTSTTTRASTRATPGISAARSRTLRGARVRPTKTSANRYRS
jgi:hypothetical protein